MKKFAFLLIAFLCSFSSLVSAQDTIVLMNGNKVPSKVTEISSKSVKYKDFKNLEGPDYVLDVLEISSIIFQNGTIQKFNETADDNVVYINDEPIGTEQPAPSKKEYGWTQQDKAQVPIDGYQVKMGQRYSENKHYYDPRMYVRQYSDPYNPILSGIASYFLPGLGQMVSGEPGRGAAFMGGTFGCYILAGVGMALTAEGMYYDYYSYNQQQPNYYGSSNSSTGAIIGVLGIIGGLSMHIYSIVDAVRVAKINNMYHQDLKDNYVSFNLKPFVGVSNSYSSLKDMPVGVTLSVSF